jgi:hypothetical protein
MQPHTPYVIGYHGCGRKLAMRLVGGEDPIKQEDRKYHWLGSGIYFWENDKQRALEWAIEKASREELEDPFVIGAVLRLRRCLDLSVRENIPLVTAAHQSLSALYAASGGAMPENKKAPKDKSDDEVMRYLDCAVINHLIKTSEEPFDTVRGLFVEGDPVYEGAEFYEKTHVEIAVRNPACIVGLFIPLV